MEKKITPITQSVLQEIEQNCLCTRVRKTARIVTQIYDECLQTSGLRSTQLNLLIALAIAQAVPLTRLADIMVLDRTTLARNLKPLENQRLVEVSSGEDRRVRLVKLTKRGYQLMEQALPYWQMAQEQVKDRLGQRQWDTLHADLLNLETQIS